MALLSGGNHVDGEADSVLPAGPGGASRTKANLRAPGGSVESARREQASLQRGRITPDGYE